MIYGPHHNPPSRHADVSISFGSLGIAITVRPLSARARTRFLQNTNSDQEQIIVSNPATSNIKQILKLSFEKLGWNISWNPKPSPRTLELVRIANEKLQQIKRRKIN